jgi:5-formyltetrahydrofolate cyclo-ligase
MIDPLMEEAKAGLRRQALERRGALDAGQRAEAAAQVARYFFDNVPVNPGEAVAGYWPLREELDCMPILSRLLDAGHAVGLPVTTGVDAPLLFRRWVEGEPLYPAGFGTMAPADNAPELTPQLVLVPLLGFDPRGMRLGYGGGYYDRTLAAAQGPVRRIGLAYGVQRFDIIPRGPHDVPLDAVITETGIEHFDRSGEAE